MIVNPQFFNYRLIIGSLIVAIAVLSVFGITNYQSIKTHQQFLEQEKKLVESELSQMILRYDEVSLKNDLINTNLETSKKETELALENLKLLKSDVAVISNYKKQLSLIKSKNNSLFTTIDSLQLRTKELENENSQDFTTLELQLKTNANLIKENKSLNLDLKKGASLRANSFKAKAYKTVLGKHTETNKAIKTESIEVCFTLAENVLTQQGDKEIYIQIVNPKNNIMADKGAINFGNSSLIYSLKEIINYNNDVLDICLNIKADTNDQPLIKGTYFIHVFHKEQKLGSTQVILN